MLRNLVDGNKRKN